LEGYGGSFSISGKMDSLENRQWMERESGEDPWLGAGNNYRLSDPLIQFLRNQNIFHLHDVHLGDPQPRGHVGWRDAASLGLPLIYMRNGFFHISTL
jgi:hypothetical protein